MSPSADLAAPITVHPPCNNCLGSTETAPENAYTCAGCMGVTYCSTECQQAHWKLHSARCRSVAHYIATKEARNNALPPHERLTLPVGISYAQLNERVGPWLRAHDQLIRWACTQALYMSMDPERIRANILQIALSPRWDSGNEPARLFRVIDIAAVPFVEAQAWSADWNVAFERFKSLRDAIEGSSPVRRVAVLFTCPPLQTTFRHIELHVEDCGGDYSRQDWKEKVIAEVEGGKDYTRALVDCKSPDKIPTLIETERLEDIDPCLLDVPLRQ